MLSELDQENMDLYGTIDVTPIPKEIVKERVELLDKHMTKLIIEDFSGNMNKINKVCKAISFWTKLSLKER